jgi:hypothetical protein
MLLGCELSVLVFPETALTVRLKNCSQHNFETRGRFLMFYEKNTS